MARTTVSAMATPAVHRFRVSVPDADQSVLAWLAAQDNVSVSVRLLVRDAIERDGFCDVLTRPVTQQPRRGRPPGSGGTASSDLTDLPDLSAAPPVLASTAESNTSRLPADEHNTDDSASTAANAANAANAENAENAVSAVPRSAPEPEHVPEPTTLPEPTTTSTAEADAVSAFLTGGGRSGNTGDRAGMDAFLT